MKKHIISKLILLFFATITTYTVFKLGFNNTEHIYLLIVFWSLASLINLPFSHVKAEKLISISIATLGLTIIACDFSLGLIGRGKGRTSTDGEFLVKHSELGATLKGTRVLRHQTWNGEIPLFDVKYNLIDGKRITSTSALKKYKGCIIFLGDSVTFGHGLNDDESFPYIVSKAFPEFKTVNLSTPSHGPHQVYKELEIDGDKDVSCQGKPTYVYYSLIYDHFRRVVGSTRWALDAPKYTYSENNQIEQKGKLCEDYPFGCKGYDLSRFTGLFNIKTFATLYDILSFKNFSNVKCDALKITKGIMNKMTKRIKESNQKAVTILNIFDMPETQSAFCNRAPQNYFEELGHDVIHYHAPALFKGDNIYHELVDRHPKPKASKEISKAIIEELRLLISKDFSQE